MPRPRRAAARAAISANRGIDTDPDPDADPDRNADAQAANDADPEFLALSQKQRRAIDRAFQRGVNALDRRSGRGRKRRKVDNSQSGEVGEGEADGGGGFVDDADADRASGQGGFVNDGGGGGFVDDEDDEDDEQGGGGFMPDEDDEEGGGSGGFLPEEADDAGAFGFFPESGNESSAPLSRASTALAPSARKSTTTTKTKIPLYILPGLLTSLGLPSDEDVLSVFRASASGWDDEPSSSAAAGAAAAAAARRKRDEDDDDSRQGVELKDFRAVCAALMEPDQDGDENMDREENEEEEEEEAFELPSDESELSSLSGSEYGGSTGRENDKGKGKGKIVVTDYADAEGNTPSSTGKAKRGKSGKMKALEEGGRPKLSSRQKELVKDLWEMLKPPNPNQNKEAVGARGTGGRADGVLGREEVKSWVRTLGEMWSDEEITEMVTLFSSQHEGRGLSYDDFGVVMLRAGLV